jgi:hypothetical protein
MLVRVLAVVALAWLILLPPLFTDGACTREFDAETARMQSEQPQYRTPEMARAYWTGREASYQFLTYDQCRKSRPRYVETCGKGPMVIGHVPVRNMICRFYRDDEIRVQLQYDDRGRLDRVQADMSPFKSFPVPFTDHQIHWAR